VSAEVSVYRASESWRDRFRAYSLVIDGAVVAKVKRGESATIAVTAGEHAIWMKINWCRSRILRLELSDNESVMVAARSGIRSLLLGLLCVTIWRTRYIKLEEQERNGPLDRTRSRSGDIP
jgi:hypothetical protein